MVQDSHKKCAIQAHFLSLSMYFRTIYYLDDCELKK